MREKGEPEDEEGLRAGIGALSLALFWTRAGRSCWKCYGHTLGKCLAQSALGSLLLWSSSLSVQKGTWGVVTDRLEDLLSCPSKKLPFPG